MSDGPTAPGVRSPSRPARGRGVGVLGGLAVLAGLAALSGVEGVSGVLLLGAGLAHVTLLAAGMLGGWTLPRGAARILNLVIVLVVVSSGAVMLPGLMTRPGASVGVARAVPFVVALVLLRAAQRRRRRDDWFLLLGAAVLFGMASFAAPERELLPLLLLGISAAEGAAFLLLLGAERTVGSARSIELDLAGRTLRRGAIRRSFEAFWLGGRLSAGFLALMLVAFLAVPRAVEEEEEVSPDVARAAGRYLPGPWPGDAPPDAPRPTARTGFRPDVVLGDIGRIKKDLRIALQVSVYRDRVPYRIPLDQAYWRGQVHAHFDGRRWSADGRGSTILSSRAIRRAEWIQLERLPARLEPFAEIGMKELHYIEQEIEIREMPRTSALFALYRPWLLDIGNEDRFVIRPGATIGLAHDHERRWGYQVVSLVPREGRPDPWLESLSAREVAMYTRVPPRHERLAAAARAVGGGGEPEEVAANLAAWLKGACRYTLDVPTLDPRRPIESFVFDVKEGHCELFASAYAMMLRSVGIPCRLVTGLRGYEYLDGGPNPLHVVRYSNAHAWVEAFFPGKGWVTLDATPGDDRAQPATAPPPPEPELDAPEPEPEEPPEPWDDWLLRYDRTAQRELVADARELVATVGEDLDAGTVGLGLAAIAGLGALLLLPGLMRRRRARRPTRAPTRTAGPGGDAVRRAYLALLAVLAGRGVRRETSETPREVARRAARALPELAAPVRGLTELHQAVVYGVRIADREDGRRAGELLAAARAALRRKTA